MASFNLVHTPPAKANQNAIAMPLSSNSRKMICILPRSVSRKLLKKCKCIVIRVVFILPFQCTYYEQNISYVLVQLFILLFYNPN